jgi:hypothetical protein
VKVERNAPLAVKIAVGLSIRPVRERGAGGATRLLLTATMMTARHDDHGRANAHFAC